MTVVSRLPNRLIYDRAADSDPLRERLDTLRRKDLDSATARAGKLDAAYAIRRATRRLHSRFEKVTSAA